MNLQIPPTEFDSRVNQLLDPIKRESQRLCDALRQSAFSTVDLAGKAR